MLYQATMSTDITKIKIKLLLNYNILIITLGVRSHMQWAIVSVVYMLIVSTTTFGSNISFSW